MIKLIEIICSILIIILLACKKDDSGLIYSNHSGLLYQVKFDSELYYEYAYNGDSELQTTTEYEFDNRHNPYKEFSSLMIPGHPK